MNRPIFRLDLDDERRPRLSILDGRNRKELVGVIPIGGSEAAQIVEARDDGLDITIETSEEYARWADMDPA